MAPGTHTGAASPLMEIGGFPLQMDETLKKKILNDATAFLRSYAEKRGRNVELAESAVTDGKAWTETEALDGKLIDLIANSPEDLLSKLDGRTIKRFDGSSTVSSRCAIRRALRFTMSFRQRFLSRIVQPDAFFISADRGSAGTLRGVYASGNGRAGSDRRDFAGVGAIRDAYSTGSAGGGRAGLYRVGAVYPGGEVHQPWRAGAGGHRGDASGRADAGAVAADPRRSKPGRRHRRDTAVRADYESC